ncbi:MAG: hypothetical protein R2698_12635 [Microthrixaceae bacterium]
MTGADATAAPSLRSAILRALVLVGGLAVGAGTAGQRLGSSSVALVAAAVGAGVGVVLVVLRACSSGS